MVIIQKRLLRVGQKENYWDDGIHYETIQRARKNIVDQRTYVD